MISLAENEQILMIIRRHWWVILGPSAMFFILLILPSIAVIALPTIIPSFDFSIWGPLAKFVFTLYILGLLLFAFILWSNYYLDVWIITNQKIIDIQQKGLFNRVVSEFSLSRVQDVSVATSGIIETMLKFGDLKVETAGHDPFTIEDVPDLYRAKDLILHYSSPSEKSQ